MQPLELYGFDVDWDSIPPSIGEDVFNHVDSDEFTPEPKVCHTECHHWCVSGGFTTMHACDPQILIDFETDPNVLVLQDTFPSEFFELFEKGVQVRSPSNL
jgi:hypothetical protein